MNDEGVFSSDNDIKVSLVNKMDVDISADYDKKFIEIEKNIDFNAILRHPDSIITIKAYRNDETFLQELPSIKVPYKSKVHLNNINAPSIEGFDFVCCDLNNFIAESDTEIKLYYIPQTIPDRNLYNWGQAFIDSVGDLSNIDIANTFSATSMNAAFQNSKITNIPKLNTSNATILSYMFDGCSDLTNLVIIYDTNSAVQNIYMFRDCINLVQIKFTGGHFKKLNNASYMFKGCTSLKNIKFPDNMDEISPSIFSGFLYDCSSLQSVELNRLNARKITNMTYAFRGCSSLNKLDLSKWVTDNLTNMRASFYQCIKLEELDISNFNTSKVTDMTNLFLGCIALITVKGVLDMSSCTSYNGMFSNTPNLIGVHLKNVPKDLDKSLLGGTEGITYIIDNYLGG